MGYGKQGWKKRVKGKYGSLHYNSKKGVTYSSSVNSGSKSTGYRYTVSSDANLPSGYIRVYETVKVGGMWKRKSKIQRTAVGVMMGCPPPYTKEYRERYGKKRKTTKRQPDNPKTTTQSNLKARASEPGTNFVGVLVWLAIIVVAVGSCVG
jgi:hypothetical protein